ncbi:uncharacterized protein LOC119591981 isoform X1 [Penaeus monodon]|uniref:uncharacterized protein LOC119591981 isoform X1 n=1 Tax=Penaeus monodon TaxID=6687 RepID=UPI0018A7AD9F|nr:uncharacterized protein LOC119591981 isoform X1 [Penaeus monodon]
MVSRGRYHSCAVCGAKKKNSENLKFHFFPRNKKRCLEWLKVLNIASLKNKSLEQLWKSYVVCSKHFCEHHYTFTGRLLSTAVPKPDQYCVDLPNTDDNHQLKVPKYDSFTTNFGVISQICCFEADAEGLTDSDAEEIIGKNSNNTGDILRTAWKKAEGDF